MKECLRKIFLSLTLLFLPVERVFAQTESTGCEVQGAATLGCIEPIFTKAVTALVELAGAVLFIMLVVGGFKYLLGGGDQKKLESAKGTITNAVIGLVVIAVAYIILLTIQTFTGVNVTKFSVTGQ